MFAGKWMELEIIMLSEIGQTEINTTFLTHMQNLDYRHENRR
jgi:hypothetical protein